MVRITKSGFIVRAPLIGRVYGIRISTSLLQFTSTVIVIRPLECYKHLISTRLIQRTFKILFNSTTILRSTDFISRIGWPRLDSRDIKSSRNHQTNSLANEKRKIYNFGSLVLELAWNLNRRRLTLQSLVKDNLHLKIGR